MTHPKIALRGKVGLNELMTDATASIFAPGLRWLIRLRWLSLCGQILLFLAAGWLLELRLPLQIIIPCLAITAGSNVLVAWQSHRLVERETCAGLLILDTTTLTILLYWLGGESNPFTAFYLLHITIAAILLPTLWTWIGVLLCGLGYGLLFLSPHKLESSAGLSCCDDHSFHLQGMLLAMVLVGICIAFFVSHLKSLLTRRDRELEKVRQQVLRNEKFASMATLAAGVAHELATPLGTIAVLSSDIVQETFTHCAGSEIQSDAELIRSEVERCRGILEKLGDDATRQVGESIQEFDLSTFTENFREFLNPALFDRLDIKQPTESVTVAIPVTTWLQSVAVIAKNACEASRVEQRVELEIALRERQVITKVRDYGHGMSTDTASRVGEPFFTTKETGKGMGLGLFLVRMFAERMKGELVIESVRNEGSTITLTFPLREEAA